MKIGGQLFVKVFTADNSAKSLLADEGMSVSVICRQLAEKNQILMDPKCSIVEHIPELYLERFYEDNESLVENVLLWTRDSTNRLYFMEKEEKYDLFVSPERYLLDAHSSERNAQLDDEAKITLVEEFFSSGTVPVPEVEGILYLKSDGKKCWKRHFFVLRASGLYYCPKGKSKSSKDLVCLTTFEMNNIYYGVGWRKKYKAPNDYGFAIKHPQIQTKSSKYIKYLCADSEQDMRFWTTGIRIAKYGRQLKENYDNITRDIMEADLDSLADRRSSSVCSMAMTIQVSPTSPVNTSALNGVSDHHINDRPMGPTSITITSNNGNNWHRMSRHDSFRSSSTTSSSSGFMSERGSNVSTPTMEQLAFEADFPVGTIKRKPSGMQPKIPLTSTTRSLALQSDDALVEMDSDSSDSEDIGFHLQCGTLKSGTLRRSATDERLKSRIYEPLREQRFHNNNKLSDSSQQPLRSDTSAMNELPLPPPPELMQTSLSTLSLNSWPPPPNEVLDSSDLDSKSTTPTCMSPVVSPKKSPQSPPVPPKPKLLRRLSETSNDRKNFINELKSRSNTLHKESDIRHKLSPDVNSAISAYATLPRMRCGPYVEAMNTSVGAISAINSNYSLSSSSSSGSEPHTPVNDVLPPSPLCQRSPVHYQPFPNQNQMPFPSPTSTPHQCCQSMPQQPIYPSYGQQSRQSQAPGEQLYQNSIQNENNNNFNKNIYHLNANKRQQLQQHCNQVSHQMSVQMSAQPFYPYSQNQQIYGTSSTSAAQQPMLPIQGFQQQQHCYQQMSNPYIGQHLEQHYQQRTQQPVPQMQVYSNQQSIYQSNPHTSANQHMVNGQTYTKTMIYSVPPLEPSERSPHKGPLPPPPEEFLREIQRVMDKKWKVAQTLSSDMSATPNEILGFRDQRYLPPNTHSNGVEHLMTSVYDVLPARPAIKSVRISSQVSEIPVLKHYNRGHRMPPQPPKRSDKTHLSGLV